MEKDSYGPNSLNFGGFVFADATYAQRTFFGIGFRDGCLFNPHLCECRPVLDNSPEQ